MRKFYWGDQRPMKEYKKDVVLSLTKFFLVNTGDEIIKLKKGMNKTDVIKVLGEPQSINQGIGPNNQKLLFKLTGNNLKHIWYSILFKENLLEWSAKVNGK